MKSNKTAQELYLELEKELNAIFFDRQVEIRAMILAHISRTHIAMLGRPGSGKSYQAKKFAEAFPSDVSSSIAYFETALNQFKKPEDIFGPTDMQAWKNSSELVYKYHNFLPNARIAFLDELSRGEDLTNILLEIVNERTFDMNGKKVDCPLEMAVTATNFKFSSDEFEAMRDRFIQWVNPQGLDLEDADKLDEYWETEEDCPIKTKIGEKVLEQVRKEHSEVKLTKSTKNVFRQILLELRDNHGILVSDRRSKRTIRSIVRASAWLNGRTEIEDEDLECIWTTLWATEEQIPTVLSVVRKFVNPEAEVIETIMNDSLVLMQGWKENPVENKTEDVSDQLRSLRKKLVKISPKAANQALWDKSDYLLGRFQESVATILTVQMSKVTL